MSVAALLSQILHDALLLFAVINPLGNIAVYASLTRDMERRERRRTFNLAVLTACLMVVSFALLGDWSLRQLFGVTLNEFRIAGGILLFIVATRGVMSDSRERWGAGHDHTALAIFPLAFPIIVGPGTLVVTIILSQNSGALLMMLSTLATFLAVYAIVISSHGLVRLLGRYAMLIVPRLLYIFLAAKAVSLIKDGIVAVVRLNWPNGAG